MKRLASTLTAAILALLLTAWVFVPVVEAQWMQTVKPPLGAQVNMAHPLARGLVGLWLFNEKAGGMLNDISGNGNHGTLTNMDPASDWVGSPRGGALDFDGSNDYANLGKKPSLNLTGQMTIAAWVKHASVAGSGGTGIVGDSDSVGDNLQWSLEINRTAGRIGYLHGGGSYMVAAANTTLTAERWYHVAVVRTGSSGSWTATFYLNGVFDGAPTSAANPAAQVGAAIGQYGTYTGQNWNGAGESVIIYNRALSAAEVAELYVNPFGMLANTLQSTLMRTPYGGAARRRNIIIADQGLTPSWTPSILNLNEAVQDAQMPVKVEGAK